MIFLHLVLASAAAGEVSAQMSLLRITSSEIQVSLGFTFKYYEVVYQYYEFANVGRFNCFHFLRHRFSNFFQVGTTFISQNVLRTTLLLGLSNSLGLP